MPSYGTLLVAVDFSDCSQDLLDQAILLAGDTTRVILLHVARVPSGLSPGAEVDGEGGKVERAGDFIQGRSLARLERFHELLRAAGVRSEVDLTEGAVAQSIVERAQHHGADLIIIGTHGRRGLARMVGGSVAASVCALAMCPVLTVRSIHKPGCRARSCDRCESHLTPELVQLIAEQDG